MSLQRSFSFAVVALASACFVTKPIGDADTGSTGAVDSSDGPGMTSMVDVTGDPDGDPLRVDCAEQDWGPTVGGGELGPLGFPVMGCNPRTSSDATGYTCCSTDPNTADGSLPSYEGKGIQGAAPLYADAANAAGTWGMCVKTSDIPAGSGLLAAAASNCPVPCNPTWSGQQVTDVCGSNRVCCQTTELGEKDCVQEAGVWRPVRGEDIGSSDVMPPTNWSEVSHDTHQDPIGTVCEALAGDSVGDVFQECIRHLTVANQRGYCMSLTPGQVCPSDPRPVASGGAGYRNVCDLMNG